jgi:DNA (cytosine-5)-methyltransferase 1
MDYVELFAGGGGGILAHQELLGHTPVAAAEIAAYPLRVLRHRIACGQLPRMTVCEDVRAVRGAAYSGIGCIAGGFPCQDVSAASGSTLGIDGERSGLVFDMLRIVGEARPAYVFAENSPHLRTKGLVRILAALDFLGYGNVAWIVLGAGAVGAPHLRKRMWLLAKQGGATGATVPAVLPSSGHWHRGALKTLSTAKTGNGALPTLTCGDAKAAGNRKSESLWTLSDVLGITKKAERHGLRLPTLASSDFRHPYSRKGLEAQLAKRSKPLRDILPYLEGGKAISPLWAEWYMGWCPDWTDLSVDRPDVATWQSVTRSGRWWSDAVEASVLPRTLASKSEVPDCANRIRALGNGQVPLCAAVAFQTLKGLL